MTKPYSIDLRERVAARVLAGEAVRSVAVVFSVGVSSGVRWPQRLPDGKRCPGKIGGHRLRILRHERGSLMERFAASDPDAIARNVP